MSDEPARKFVKPAHPGACIPDPAHPGLDLPQGGAEVPWDHHWIARERNGEVIIVDAPVAVPLTEAEGVDAVAMVEPAPAALPAANAGTNEAGAAVSFMITKAQRAVLRERGFSDEQIATMTPEDAHGELQKPAAAQAD